MADRAPRAGAASHAFVAVGLATSCALAACSFSSGNEPRTYRGTQDRADIALRTAAEDLGCPVASLLIATTLERRYTNTSAARYVIDGCGERGLYVEQCELSEQPSGEGFRQVDGASSSLRCRYLIVSRVSLPSKPAAVSPSPLGSPAPLIRPAAPAATPPASETPTPF